METKPKLIVLITVLLALSLGGCGWQFSLFSYEATVEAEPAIEQLAEAQPVGADGEVIDSAYTTPASLATAIATGNPVADIFSQIIANSGAVDATKTLAICIVGDPSAIAAFRVDNRLIKKVTTTKRFFVIKTKDSK